MWGASDEGMRALAQLSLQACRVEQPRDNPMFGCRGVRLDCFRGALDGVVDARDRAASKLAGSLVLRPLPRSIGGSRLYIGRQRLEGWLRSRGGPAYRGWPAALSATLASRTEHSLPGSPGLMPKNPSAPYGQDPCNLRASRKSSPSERKCRVVPSIDFRNTRRFARCGAVNCV